MYTDNGFQKLDSDWALKLMSDKFYIKDCVGDGNCQFRAIEQALNTSMTHLRLRNVIAKQIKKISKPEFGTLIEHYRIEKNKGEFEGEWDPNTVVTKKDFIDQVTKPGFHFQGDNHTLALISQALKVDFVIFDSDYGIYSTNDTNDKLVILFYDKTLKHYQTIGLQKTSKIHTVFKRTKLPSEIQLVLDKHEFYLKHLMDIVSKNKSITLNTLLMQLQGRLKYQLSKKDIVQVIKLARPILVNQKFLNSIL
jgi:hypothetical protein